MSCLLIFVLIAQITLIKFIFCDFVFIDSALDEGDVCQFNETLNGICTRHCKQAEDDFSKFKVFPKICSFSYGISLYCCTVNTSNINGSNNSLTNNWKIINGGTDAQNHQIFYKEFDSCPYNESIIGICREHCPDLKFPQYKILVKEKVSCPVNRGRPLECCINHLQISYPSEIFSLENIYNEGDFCPFNNSIIGICENKCDGHDNLPQVGTFHRQNPICNYQSDGTPIYCCSDYLYTDGQVREVVPFASPGDLCSHQISKWGICKENCRKLETYPKLSVKRVNMCPHEMRQKPLYCCPRLSETDELEKYRNVSCGRIYYKMCQQYVSRKLKRFKRRIRYKSKTPIRHIAGGWNTYFGNFPHMAAIGWTNSDGNVEWKCGGTLISDDFVLTAAHCTIDNSIPPDTIRIGDQYLHRIEDSTRLPQNFVIAKIIKHNNYSHFSTYNDIALIQLNQSIVPTSIVNPACLWNDNDDTDLELHSVAVGYGSTEFGGRKSGELLQIQLERFNHEECLDSYKNYTLVSKLKDGILDTQLCAADRSGLQDTCQGDSGGPLEYIINDVHYIFGITSFGQACPSQVPGVYTKISKYLDWIESIVWSNILNG